MRYKVVVLGTLMAGAVFSSTSMTLGRARGAAWIGQPLALTIPVQLDAGQSATTLCPEADVFHAESKVESSRVNIAVESTTQADSVNLRITSSAVIDEPVVTIYLRAGCSQKTTRKFVLLADFPTETLAPIAATPMEVTPAMPVLVNPESPGPSKESATASAPTETRAEPVKTNADRIRKAPVNPSVKPTAPKPPAPVAATPAPAASRPLKSAPSVAAKSGDAARSRLKLDPLENLAERIKTLEATTPPPPPLEEMARESQRMQQLQTDIKTLMEQASKNEASLLAMRQRMEKAESERVSMGVVWALGALVLVCLAAVAALWSRNKKSELNAWQQSVQEASAEVTLHSVESEPDGVAPIPAAAPVAQEKSHSPSPDATAQIDLSPTSTTEVDVNLVDLDSDFNALITATASPQDTAAISIQPSKSREARLTHPDFYTDDLGDVRQQAEFFQKLGKLDLAIAVLEQRIQLNKADSPLLYLDLLQITHANDLKTDFRQFRDEFQKAFNVNIPEFVMFRNTGRSLESFPSLMRDICQSWPTHKALEIIESCVIKDPWETKAEPFDISAFSDLVSLHGTLTRLLKSSGTQNQVDIET